MSRIRTIKPEFFTSEDIVGMSPLARLFYVSLWCESDREGRMEWKPGTFKMRYFPGDNVNVTDLAAELIERGLVILYEVDGKQYAEIPTFTEHQVINNREAKSKIPAKPADTTVTRDPRVKAEGKEGRKGKEGNDASGGATPPAAPPVDFDPAKELASRGVSEQTASDWLALRKKKKAPVTATALRDIITEAGKVNLPLERALTISCRRGWTGFESSWLRAEDIAAATPQAKKDWI